MSALEDLMLADAPALLWPLDDTSGTVATDVSGNGRHGTYHGAPTLGAQGPEVCSDPDDRAVELDGNGTGPGSAQYMNRLTSPISGTGAFSAEVWFRPREDAFTRTGRRALNFLQQRTNPRINFDAGMYRVGADRDSETVFLHVGGAGRIVSAPLAPLAARRGCWNLFGVTRSGNLWTLYLNGAPVGTGSRAETITAENFSVGGDRSDIDPFYSIEEMELARGRFANAALYGSTLSTEAFAARWALGCTACGGWGIGQVRI